MAYDLDAIERHCAELRLTYERQPREIRVELLPARLLCFANLEGEEDETIAGFLGQPWHFHENLILMTGPDSCIEMEPRELLSRCQAGQILLVELFHDGYLADCWLTHRSDKLDLVGVSEAEELRVRRFSGPQP